MWHWPLCQHGSFHIDFIQGILDFLVAGWRLIPGNRITDCIRDVADYRCSDLFLHPGQNIMVLIPRDGFIYPHPPEPVFGSSRFQCHHGESFFWSPAAGVLLHDLSCCGHLPLSVWWRVAFQFMTTWLIRLGFSRFFPSTVRWFAPGPVGTVI